MPIAPSRPRSSLPSQALPAAAACGLLLLLSGCSGMNSLYRTFGLTRDAPDEFTVTTRAPLSMPPDFTLRPPRPGAPRPQEQSERQAAEEALVPQLALNQPQAGASAGQDALLAETGPAAPADIRQKVNQDARYAADDQSLIDKILYWRKPGTEGAQVDAQKEAQRLRQNAALGQPPDVGETPIIQQKPKGWLSWLPWM
ncbi:DUF3035 domain-containing protein [Rhodopila sp.]|jgi:hypothetical protein|uniref:DUF3035 domain-containing protein n=1 Tax=Rhodopila sp. TaxID=2480087 RepID=UPI002C36AEBE|nr:DUF3035 domain-containing protein [Rhodopila sp.]HVZ08135.1 DUF3035 domain-containing protein [Rhodopila sp.]